MTDDFLQCCGCLQILVGHYMLLPGSPQELLCCKAFLPKQLINIQRNEHMLSFLTIKSSA